MNRDFGNSGSRDRFGSDRPRNNDFGNAPPVNVGEEIDVKIEAVGEKGDGVAKKNGFVIFVPGVKEGQNVRVKITRVLRKVGFAEVVGHASAPAKEAEAEPEAEYSEEKDSDNFGDEESSDAPAEETQAEDSEASEDFGDDEEENK